MRLTYVMALSSWGLGMGVLTSFSRLPWGVEFLLWGGAALAWIAVIHWRELAPFVNGWATSLLAGTLFGAIRGLLQGWIRTTDPLLAESLPPTMPGAAVALLSQGAVAGFLAGILVGGLALALSFRSAGPPSTRRTGGLD